MEIQVDGKRVFATTGGREHAPELPTVLLVHGAGMDHTVWVLQARYFAYHDRNVLAVDFPGHGRSEGPALDTIGDMADWLAHLLDAVGIDQAAVVGHSMGSLAALALSARYPQRVRSVALLGTAMPMAVSDQLLAAAKANDHDAIDMITVWGHGQEAHFGGHRVPGLWMIGGSERLLERVADGILFTDLKACDDYRDGLEAASQVTCPVLVVLGRGDRMTPPRAAQELTGAFSDARVVIIEHCGHMMMIEQSDRVLDALKDAV